MRFLALLLLISCSASGKLAAPEGGAAPSASSASGPGSASAPTTSATPPASSPEAAPMSSPASQATPASAATTHHAVVARLVGGEVPVIACGIIAFNAAYVYEIVRVNEGPSLSGRVVVDVLCPDIWMHGNKVRFEAGEIHSLILIPPKPSYAGALARPSPEPTAPRYYAEQVAPAPP